MRTKSKTILIASSLVIVSIIIGLFIYFKFIHKNVSINIHKVESVDVTITDGLDNGLYCNNPHFTVKDENNIKYIIDALNHPDTPGNRYCDCCIKPAHLDFNFKLKDGSTQSYSLDDYSLSDESYINDMLCSKEVVPQIRTAFTLDRAQIAKVEYYYWDASQGAAAVTKEIKDKDLIEKLIIIAQKDALESGISSAKNTCSGFQFTARNDAIVLDINISSSMAGYDELIKLFPSVPDHVN